MIRLPQALKGLPEVPPPELDPLLDAATNCFLRHGVSRTRVPDIAAAMGVNRVTVYRQAGNVSSVARLLLARELHRMLEALPVILADENGPASVRRLVATVVEACRRHPVMAKVLADEPEVIGPFLNELPAVIERGSAAVAPVLDAMMHSGDLMRRDPQVLAELLVRLAVTLVVAPADERLDALLDQTLTPLLEPLP
ncbi:MAG: hypothetical protein JJLCMIEE_00921 [Acidimicrobiales bacterium]|nr:hypothetical protein [Acidimicrobiales bacterium]